MNMTSIIIKLILGLLAVPVIAGLLAIVIATAIGLIKGLIKILKGNKNDKMNSGIDFEKYNGKSKRELMELARSHIDELSAICYNIDMGDMLIPGTTLTTHAVMIIRSVAISNYMARNEKNSHNQTEDFNLTIKFNEGEKDETAEEKA